MKLRLSGAGAQSGLVSKLEEQHDFIEYTGPYDYERDAPGLYQALDVVFAVYPLDIYNYRVHVARRLHDAVLSSTPIVVSRDTHMAEIVAAQQVGWSVGHESVSDIIELFTAIYDDPERINQCVQQAVQVQSEHAFEFYRDDYLKAYRKTVKTKVGSSGD